MEADYASKKLMDAENGRLRAELFAKKNKPAKQRVGGAGARHMTAEDTLRELAFVDWKAGIAAVHSEFSANAQVKAAKATYDGAWKAMMERWQQLEKDVISAGKAAEREAKRAEAEVEKAAKKAEADALKAAEKVKKAAEKADKDAEKAAERAAEKARKEMDRAEKRDAAEAEKAKKKEEKRVAAEQKKLNAMERRPRAGKKRKQQFNDELTDSENLPPFPGPYTPDTPPALKRPRPQPIPAYRGAAAPVAGRGDAEVAASRSFGDNVTNYVAVIDPVLL
jgi:hypothetical protein